MAPRVELGRRSLLLATALLLAAAGLSGCVIAQSTAGRSVDRGALEGIVPGETTRAEVTRLLGPPDEIIHSSREHDPLFERAFRYEFRKARQTALFLLIFSTYRSDSKSDAVIIFFDERGIVEHVGSRFDANRASYGAPW
ncbi:MAG: hypothetical protein ACE5GW_06450 [Planctomycetota bacterium]